MPVDVQKFSKLLTTESFRDWVITRKPDILSVFDAAKSDESAAYVYKQLASGELTEYLNNNHLDVFAEVVEEVSELSRYIVAPPGPDKNEIFSNYNPYLLRFPMQMMLHGVDHADTKAAVNLFCQDMSTIVTVDSRAYHVIDKVTLNDWAYVEYLPQYLHKYVINIPESNWEIKKWRKRAKISIGK